MPTLDIAIVGEINLDLILYGLPADMPMERELLASDFAITLGSSSAILAHNLAALGSRVGFITKVGADSFGSLALDQLSQQGIDLSRVAHGVKSGVTIILPHGPQRHILTYPGTISELRFEDLDFDYLATARHFHLSSLFLQRELLPRVPEVFQRMKAAGLTTSLDTNDDPDDQWGGILAEILPHVDILLPNEREAMKMCGTDDLEYALRELSKNVATIVVKMGARGALAISDGQRSFAAGVPVTTFDTVGAGDSFNAGFLHQYLLGASLKDCLIYGNLCGAFSATARGGTEAFRDRTRLQEFLRELETGKSI
jgi:sugar/nucleoside kinase (ribokinase family)